MRSRYVKVFRDINNLVKLVQFYKRGYTLHRIAMFFQIHHTSILHQIQKYGIQRKDPRNVKQILGILHVAPCREVPPKIKKQVRYRIHEPRFFISQSLPREKNYADHLKDKGLRLVTSPYGTYAVRVKKDDLPVSRKMV